MPSSSSQTTTLRSHRRWAARSVKRAASHPLPARLGCSRCSPAGARVPLRRRLSPPVRRTNAQVSTAPTVTRPTSTQVDSPSAVAEAPARRAGRPGCSGRPPRRRRGRQPAVTRTIASTPAAVGARRASMPPWTSRVDQAERDAEEQVAGARRRAVGVDLGQQASRPPGHPTVIGRRGPRRLISGPQRAR